MYELLSAISTAITEPVSVLIDSFGNHPWIAAFMLGLIGAVAPCQLTGNMSAITLYGNQSIQKKSNTGEIISFVLGKVAVFGSIGLLTWLFGESFESTLTGYFPLFRKMIGPIIIITGLVLLGILKLRLLQRLTRFIPMPFRSGKVGSFLLGVSFSLAFCPTMFVLYFLWLMPMVVTSSYGFILPVIFGIATSIPLILLFLLIWLFDGKRLIMKAGMKTGRIVQRLAGVLLLCIGVADIVTYWGM